ncbi:hypothetical protein X747_05445 [Mesorhizobium sp. LNJC384A00]|nr:hypothetical protein X747_05445 [Mesorhizobium sp. LNJC384A00]
MDLTYSLVVSLWCARSGLTIPLLQPFGCRQPGKAFRNVWFWPLGHGAKLSHQDTPQPMSSGTW